jgi:hypothetical protein
MMVVQVPFAHSASIQEFWLSYCLYCAKGNCSLSIPCTVINVQRLETGPLIRQWLRYTRAGLANLLDSKCPNCR